MASSSSSKRNYDVFLSFRGDDTRNTFTSHLNERLIRKGIFTFIDKRLEEGSTISVELLNAIEQSQVAVVIFSKDYASSRWCLDELVKITNCRKESKQKVIPVFCGIDPSVVRHQKGSFGEFLAGEEAKYTQTDNVEGKHKVKEWRNALTEVANLKGHDIRGRDESECITEIVNRISKKIHKTSPFSSVQDVVGFDTHLEKLMALLDMEADDVRVIGIWGMGGIGKTAIAKALFDTLLHSTPSYQFDAACFLDNVNEEVKTKGICSVQNTLLKSLLEEEVNNKHDGKDMMSTRLKSKKVLIVLDDIVHRDQVEYLAGDKLDWFGKGSRIIVTTRDQDLIVGERYEVPLLTDPLDIELFNRHAFKNNEVPGDPFEKLSLEVLNCAKGLPLALIVYAAWLNNQEITVWRKAVDHVKENSNSEIVEKLKISFDRLNLQEKEMFLHIACLYRGHSMDELIQILESCSITSTGLRALIRKSLLIPDGGSIQMHDLNQDMGKHVVESQKEQGESSRIWCDKNFKRVMINNTGNHAVKAIRVVDPPNFKMSKDAMGRMHNLSILQIEQSKDTLYHKGNCHLTCDGDFIECLPDNLRWFVWKYYPSGSLPPNFDPENLVHLELEESKLRQLWTSQKELPKLRKIILRGSAQLEQTPDFTMIRNLEILDLSYCTSLKEVHDSLGDCRKLTKLDLSDCEKLIALPSSICKLKKLVKLHVSGCKKLESLPEEIGNLKNLEELYAKDTLISQPPSSIVRLTELKHLSFAKHQSTVLKPLPPFVFPRVNEGVNEGLDSLEELDLDYCNLRDGGLPEDIGSLSALQVLRLRENHFYRLPLSIVRLIALQILDLTHCKQLEELPELPPNIVKLFADYHLAKGSIQNLATKNMKLQLVTFTSLSTTDESSDDQINDLLAETISRYFSSLQDVISASDSLSLRTITLIHHPGTRIPRCFDLEGVAMHADDLHINLPKDWYARGNFLGFALCFIGEAFKNWWIRKLTLLSNEDESEQLSVTLKCRQDAWEEYNGAYFLFVPFNSFCYASKASERTPYYGLLKLETCGKIEKLRGHLLYKKPDYMQIINWIREVFKV